MSCLDPGLNEMEKVVDLQRARCDKIREQALAYLRNHPRGYAQAVIDMERNPVGIFGRELTSPDKHALRQLVIDFFSEPTPPGMVS